MPEQNTTSEPILLPEYALSHAREIAAQHNIRIDHGGRPAKLNEYELFIIHCSTPSKERPTDEKTHTDFAKKYGVHVNTLSRWGQKKSFLAAVKARRRAWTQAYIPDALESLAKTAIATGRAKEVALLLEYGEDFHSKVMQAGLGNGQEEYTIDDVRRILQNLPPERQKYLSDLLIQIFNEAAEYARRSTEINDGIDGVELPANSGELPGSSDHAHEADSAAYQMATEDS